MHIEGIQSSVVSVQRQRETLYIVWGNPQPISHDHFVVDSLTCILAGQLLNCLNWYFSLFMRFVTHELGLI